MSTLNSFRIQFQVTGMTCNSCVSRVHEAITSNPNTSSIDVSLQTGIATFLYNTNHQNIDSNIITQLVNKVKTVSGKDTTFLSISHNITFHVQGMTCINCVHSVENALKLFPQVSHIIVSLDTGLAQFWYSGNIDHIPNIAQAVQKESGKVTTIVNNDSTQKSTQLRKITLKIEGMTCINCVKKVKTTLDTFNDVYNSQVSLESGLAVFEYSGANENQIATAVQQGSGKTTSVIKDVNTIQPRVVTLKVEGMSCNGCVKRVKDALAKFEDVSNVDVSLDTGLAVFTYTGTEDNVLASAVQEGSGKTTSVVQKTDAVQVQNVTLLVEGMTCMGCVGRVSDALEKLDTSDVSVSLETGLATFKYFGNDVQGLIKTVKEEAGKEIKLVMDDEDQNLTSTPNLHTITIDSPERIPDTVSLVSDEFPTPPPMQMPKSSDQLTTTQIRVGGMTCSSCVGMVESVLCKLTGVSTAKVNLLAGRATVTHDNTQIQAQALADAVSDSGYESFVLDTKGPNDESGNTESSVRFRIDFPTDLQAQNGLKILRFMDSVEKVEVTGISATVLLKRGSFKSTVLRALETQGSFGKLFVHSTFEDERADLLAGQGQKATDVIDEEADMWRRRFLLSLSFLLPIILVSFLHNHFNFLPMRAVQWVGFILATPVQFVCGRGFYRASYYALKKRRATMDVLVALSTSIAYFSSVVVVVFDLGKAGNMSLGHAAMFRVSAMIITMVLIGKWLETSAKRKAAAGVAALSELTPESAVLFDVENQVTCYTEVPVKLLQVGDVVRLIAGDRIPVDGEIIEGISAVDESMLTGESRPVPKSIGDSVYGGTVNGNGSMLVRTTAVGSHAVLSQIIKLVNDAQTSRAPVEAFADRVSAVFVPAVVSISTAVFFVWYGLAVFEKIPAEWYEGEGKLFFALLFALETLVIACPCALGLATPTAVMVASEVGTRMGVLFRGGGAALEAANNIKTVLFDKTGTLTMGRPEVVAVMIGERGCKMMEQAPVILSDLVYLLESQSHHPLASAIRNHIDGQSMLVQSPNNPAPYKISAMEEVPGRGIIATINNGEYRVRIGVPVWAFGKTPASELLTDSEIRKMQKMEEENGLSVVAAVVNDQLVSIYGLEDRMRPEAADVVDALHSMNISTGLVTGDSLESGRAVAVNAGISAMDVHARALPWTKVSVVEDKAPSCFIGDGINDAPALAAAKVGIAIGTGAPTAAESASIVLVRADLYGVVNALALAKATFRRVRLNFCWAIGYNLIGIPLAAGVLYPLFQVRVPPFVASGAMALSSTCVVLSSLALRWFTPTITRQTRFENLEETEMIEMRPRFVIEDEYEDGRSHGKTLGYSKRQQMSPGSGSSVSTGTEEDYVPLLNRGPEIVIT